MEERGVGGDWWIDESDERARDDEPLVRIRCCRLVRGRCSPGLEEISGVDGKVFRILVRLMVRYSGY